MNYTGNIIADMFDEDRERKDDEDDELIETETCAVCGKEVPEIETDRNFGSCAACALKEDL